MKWKRWGNPRHKPITDCKVKELARVKLLHLINLLEQRGDSPEAVERVVGFLREESLAALNYHILLLEEKLEIPKEDRTQPIPYHKAGDELGYEKEEPTQRVKRTKRAKKKIPQRGGLFG